MRDDADTAELKAVLLDGSLKFPASHWEQVTGVQIIDADGWAGVNEEGFQLCPWEAPITKDEFLRRAAESTAQYPRHFFERQAAKLARAVVESMQKAVKDTSWVRRPQQADGTDAPPAEIITRTFYTA